MYNKIVAFHTPQICFRGTSNCIYNYAHYNEVLLNNKSIIVMPENGLHQTDKIAYKKFTDRFDIKLYDNNDKLIDILKDCNICYMIKYGKKDNLELPKNIKTVIHCVFDMSEPHGDVYAAVSEQIAHKFNSKLFVPHIVELKTLNTDNLNMRKELNIPDDAIVFGRYGGKDTFNLDIAYNAISNVVNTAHNIYFLLINTPKFYNHKNIIYLNTIYEDDDKIKFINTCDAGLECGTLGHTFGLAVGEFNILKKPVICYNNNLWNNCHIQTLKEQGIYFKNEEELYKILISFKPYLIENPNYGKYTPEYVMNIFNNIFIK